MSTLDWIAAALYFSVLLGVLRHVSASRLLANRHQQHLIFGSAATLFTLWMFRAGIYDGLDVHFIGLSTITLLLGFRHALLAGTLALLGATAAGYGQWQDMGVNGLVGVVLPISITYLVYVVSFHRLPRHVFVYIFICAFFPGALSIAMKSLAMAGFYYIDGIYPWDVLFDNYVLLTPLLLFPEALLNGMAITLLVIYQPTWVYTFHDKFYINDK